MSEPVRSAPSPSGRGVGARAGAVAKTGAKMGAKAGVGTGTGTLDLQAFFPYRLAVLAEQVSLALAAVYTDRFDLTRQEWRILALLGTRAAIAATELGRAATLDKMQVSRAIRGLEARGLIRRSEAADDRRRKIVTLTAAGRALYRRIAPLAARRAAAILRGLSPRETLQLGAMMTRIAEAASALRAHDGA